MSDLPEPFELEQPLWVKSGLTSGSNYKWQKDLRWMSDRIGDAWFDPSDSGYEHADYCAAYLIQNRIQDQEFLTHSNGGYFVCRVAQLLEPHGLRVRICNFDRTMKMCPTLGANAKNVLDLWAGPPMRRLGVNTRFTDAGNEIIRKDFKDESHISILRNPEARALAIEFCKKWKRS